MRVQFHSEFTRKCNYQIHSPGTHSQHLTAKGSIQISSSLFCPQLQLQFIHTYAFGGDHSGDLNRIRICAAYFNFSVAVVYDQLRQLVSLQFKLLR
ncbi:hypothetical protein D3C81_1801530 [compost metagenome]